ncbi:MAG: hypothetical protein ABL921_09280 [Pirellula sp.]
MPRLMIALGVGLICLVCYGQQPERPKKLPAVADVVDDVPKVTTEKTMSFWMAKKLEHSKSILESLTKGDFEKLATDATKMQLLGKLEGFVRRSNKDYKTQLHSFELANQELIRQANRRNAEGATLAFNQLTTSCVACHTLLREGVE